MSWATVINLIFGSMVQLGAILLVLAVILVFLDVPGKGVAWDKVGAWFGIVGGFGVGGGAAGWVGNALVAASGGALRGGADAGTRLFGASIVIALLAGAFLWAVSRARGQGIDSKSKLKSLFVVGLFALVGTFISLIPYLYDGANYLLAQGSSALADILA